MTLPPTRPTQFVDLLDALARHRVEYVVVGAVAAAIAGVPIVTHDLDVVFDPAPANRARLLAALEALDARYLDPADRLIRPDAERLASLRLHLLRTRLGRLDLMTTIGPAWGFADLAPRSRRYRIGEIDVPVLDLEAVIQSKEHANRPKDRAGLDVLRETLRLRRARSVSPDDPAEETR